MKARVSAPAGCWCEWFQVSAVSYVLASLSFFPLLHFVNHGYHADDHTNHAHHEGDEVEVFFAKGDE